VRECEEAILEGKSFVSLNTRISKEANEMLVIAWSMLQSEYNFSRLSKQSVVTKIICEGAKSICEQMQTKYKDTSQLITTSEEIITEYELIETNPEKKQTITEEIHTVSEEKQKPVEDINFYTNRYGVSIAGKEPNYNGLDVPSILKNKPKRG
jgi:hypothetical protein